MLGLARSVRDAFAVREGLPVSSRPPEDFAHLQMVRSVKMHITGGIRIPCAVQPRFATALSRLFSLQVGEIRSPSVLADKEADR